MLKSGPTVRGIGEYRVLEVLEKHEARTISPTKLCFEADVDRTLEYTIRERLISSELITTQSKVNNGRYPVIVITTRDCLRKRMEEIEAGHKKILVNRVSVLRVRVNSIQRVLSDINWGSTVYLPVIEKKLQSAANLRVCLSVLHAVNIVNLVRLNSFEGKIESGIESCRDYYTVSQGSDYECLWNKKALDEKLLGVEFGDGAITC
jgi:hypothetical protein